MNTYTEQDNSVTCARELTDHSLKKCETEPEHRRWDFTVQLEDGSKKTVRVFGTRADPHFSAKDICDIMDIKDYKNTIAELVPLSQKIDLKNLLVDLNNAPKHPSWMSVRNPPDLLNSVNLLTLSHKDKRLVVLSEPGVYNLVNKFKSNKKFLIFIETFDKVMYGLKYENCVGLVDIFSFACNMQIALDIDSDWFQDLWYPLIKSRPPEGPNFDVEQPFILTQNLLKWLGFKGCNNVDIQDNFKKSLDSLKLPYKEISALDPLAISYSRIQAEFLDLETSNNLVNKKWICMDVKQFKKVIMRLNTENADLVRDYYLNLEELVFNYSEYTKMYLIAQKEKEMCHIMHQLAIKEKFEEKLRNQLAIKERSEKELKKEKEKLQTQLAIKERFEEELKKEQKKISRELENVKKTEVKTRNMLEKEREAREKTETQKKIAELRAATLTRLNATFQERVKSQIFYIATSKAMAKNNEFKIGGVENYTSLKKRLSMYNTGNSEVHSELTMFFVFFAEVANYKQMETRVKKLIHPFRSKQIANSENFNLHFNLHFNILKPVVEMISENYNKEIDQLNELFRTLLETRTCEYVEPAEVEAIDLDCVLDRLDVQLSSRKPDNDRTGSKRSGADRLTQSREFDEATHVATSYSDRRELATSYSDRRELATSYSDRRELATSYSDRRELATTKRKFGTTHIQKVNIPELNDTTPSTVCERNTTPLTVCERNTTPSTVCERNTTLSTVCERDTVPSVVCERNTTLSTVCERDTVPSVVCERDTPLEKVVLRIIETLETGSVLKRQDIERLLDSCTVLNTNKTI